MRQNILILVLASLQATPCLANVPSFDFIAQEKAKGINIAGVGGSSPLEAHFHLDGASGTTPAQMTQALSDAQSFDWTVYPDANPVAAAGAVQADTNIPIDVQIQLGSFAGVLALYPYNPSGVQQYWANLKQKQSSWLTPTLAQIIENDCLSASVVLNVSNNPQNVKLPRPKRKVK